jgi:hypothetical protein
VVSGVGKASRIIGKERFPDVLFQGKKMELPPAPLAIDRAGPARTEAIGDYRKLR